MCTSYEMPMFQSEFETSKINGGHVFVNLCLIQSYIILRGWKSYSPPPWWKDSAPLSGKSWSHPQCCHVWPNGTPNSMVRGEKSPMKLKLFQGFTFPVLETKKKFGKVWEKIDEKDKYFTSACGLIGEEWLGSIPLRLVCIQYRISRKHSNRY